MGNEERSASQPQAAGVEGAEAAASSAGVPSGAAHENDAGQDDVGGGPVLSGSAAEGEATSPAAEDADQDGSAEDPTEEHQAAPQVETAYERAPGGHRLTRRTVRRKKKTSREHVEETITEDLPIPVYSSPRGAPHPAPVG